MTEFKCLKADVIIQKKMSPWKSEKDAVIYFSHVNPSKSKSSRSEMFFKIGAFKNLRSFIGKDLCCCLVLMKLHKISERFLRTAFFTEHLRWLSLEGFCEGTSLVKILLSFHFSIFGTITDAWERWPTIKENNE